jgi:hypothetical protein
MTALLAALQHTEDKWTFKEMPLGFSAKCWKGGTAVGRPSTGTVFPATTGAGAAGANDLYLGIFNESVDNSANAGTTLPVTINFVKEVTILWRANDGSITAANLFNPCYAVDDQTVSATATNRPKVGNILAVDPILGVGFSPTGV